MAVGFGVALLQLSAAAQEKPAATNAATNAPKLSPQEQKERWSYAIGMNIGNSIKRGGVELDVDTMAAAMKDILAGKEPKITDQQAQEAFRSYQMESRSKQEEMRKQTAEKNKKAGEAFLAENKNKPGVKTHTANLPSGGTAEMQYKVITEGTGAIPKSNDVVAGQLSRHADQRQGVRQLDQARRQARQVSGRPGCPRVDRGAAE